MYNLLQASHGFSKSINSPVLLTPQTLATNGILLAESGQFPNDLGKGQ